MTVRQVLIGAYNRLSNKERWTKCQLAIDKSGTPCDVNNPEAEKFCALGAMLYETGGDDEASLYVKSVQELADVLTEMGTVESDDPFFVVYRTNDRVGYEQVMEGLRRAIEKQSKTAV